MQNKKIQAMDQCKNAMCHKQSLEFMDFYLDAFGSLNHVFTLIYMCIFDIYEACNHKTPIKFNPCVTKVNYFSLHLPKLGTLGRHVMNSSRTQIFCNLCAMCVGVCNFFIVYT
jgi:hypothetical protein